MTGVVRTGIGKALQGNGRAYWLGRRGPICTQEMRPRHPQAIENQICY